MNVKMLVQTKKMRNKTINNRLHEDLLDDIEARSTSVSKRIVDDADTNTRLAEGVASEIIQQNTALQNISNGTEQLQRKVSSLEDYLNNIGHAIDEIDSNASANAAVAEKISGALC